MLTLTKLACLLTYSLTHSLTHSTQHIPSWEANQFAASQEIRRILWNPKVHYSINKCPPTVPILSQPNPVHTSTSHFLKICFNIILPSMPNSPQRCLSLRFPHQNTLHASSLLHSRYMHRQSHSFLFYHPYNILTKLTIIKKISAKLHTRPTPILIVKLNKERYIFYITLTHCGPVFFPLYLSQIINSK
jgi:hypothetical protein